jgi:flagellum-specific peptidoglycan hydrolase FlgJ
MPTLQQEFLVRAAAAARAAGHLYPDFAACEAALESGWGHSQLAVEANNLFGQKQAHPPLDGTETVSLPTREFLHGAWVAVQANWVRFADWESCFRERMALLRSLARAWPNYRKALAAKTGEQFIAAVSRTWSTDPARAGKVLAVYDAHRGAFEPMDEPGREAAAKPAPAAPQPQPNTSVAAEHA